MVSGQASERAFCDRSWMVPWLSLASAMRSCCTAWLGWPAILTARAAWSGAARKDAVGFLKEHLTLTVGDSSVSMLLSVIAPLQSSSVRWFAGDNAKGSRSPEKRGLNRGREKVLMPTEGLETRRRIRDGEGFRPLRGCCV